MRSLFPPSSAPSLKPLLTALLLTLSGLVACPSPTPPPPVHDGPIVLITLDALRADVLGSLGGPEGLTPHLDAVAEEADLVTRAVATSSWTVPSMASLFTGMQPWRHGNQHSERTVLSDERLTLPEALQAHGYTTSAFRSNHWLQKKYGYAQGFEIFRDLGYGKRALRYLRELPDGRQFVWIHILPPHAPYVRHDPLLSHLPEDLRDEVGELPDKVRPLDLEPYYDPAVTLPAAERQRFWAMYLSNVAWADELVGKLTAALKEAGVWDRTLLAITADHGEEFGEAGQIAHGGNLHRALIEVPLLVKLPETFDRDLDLGSGTATGAANGATSGAAQSAPHVSPATPAKPVAQHRLFATLLAAAGAGVPSYAAPSLFEPAPEGVLSELYLGNGVNQFSWLQGDEQLLWTSHFAAPEAEYFGARLQILGSPQPDLTGDPKELFARQAEAYRQQLPLTGRAGQEPDLQLYRWTAEGTSELLDDEQQRQRLARRLRQTWLDLNGDEVRPSQLGPDGTPELTPEEEAEMRSLGYAGGGAP